MGGTKEFLERVYKKNSNFVYRKIANESIIIPIVNNSADLTSIYTLNETADFIWNELGKNKNIESIINSLTKEFGTSYDEAIDDTITFIKNLKKLGLIDIGQ
jgi:hypothetical protein